MTDLLEVRAADSGPFPTWPVRRRRCSLIGALVLALLSCAMAVAAGNAASAQDLRGKLTCGAFINTPPSTINAASEGTKIREAIVCLINAERTTRQLPALSLNDSLQAAADGHAQEAARLRWWVPGADSHVHPQTNRTPHDRIVAAGYCQGNPTATREITYSGSGSDPSRCTFGTGSCSTPAAAVNWWMNISTFGHREAVLATNVRQIGVGFSGVDANGNAAPHAERGTYVVNMADCPVLITPPPPPPPPPAPSAGGSGPVSVTFTTMKVNSCPEVGTCDWKLSCKIADQPVTELFGMEESNSEVPINRALTQEGGTLPVSVACTVWERDGPFLFFDSPVWELVGTSTGVFASGDRSLQVAQNTDEGDVTVNFRVALTGTSTGGLAATPPPPPAPTGCGIPPESPATCGFVTVKCNAPLPVADEFILPGVGATAYRVVRDLGLVEGEYMNEGEVALAVCARNSGGTRCSSSFFATLGPSYCPSPPPRPRPCPAGEFLCHGGQCRPAGQCQFLQ